MPIGPNEDGAELYRMHMESQPCPTCGAKESEYISLLAELARFRKMRDQDCMVNDEDGRCMVHGYCDGNKKYIEQLRAAVEWALADKEMLPWSLFKAELRRRYSGKGRE